jgi:hypothetical protein
LTEQQMNRVAAEVKNVITNVAAEAKNAINH